MAREGRRRGRDNYGKMPLLVRSRESINPALRTVEVVSAPLLLVEDEPLLQRIVRHYLEDMGCRVVTASSCTEATQILDTSSALAGLITDIRLGTGQTGWDVARDARKLFPNLPIIYITADSAHQWPNQGLPKSHLLTKPFIPDKLRDIVTQWVTHAV